VSKATIENAVEWLVTQGAIGEDGAKLALRDDGAALRGVIDGIAPHLAS